MADYEFAIDDKSDIKRPTILVHEVDGTTQPLVFNKKGVARISLQAGFHLIFWVASGSLNQSVKVNVTRDEKPAIKPITGKIPANGVAKGARILNVE